jgi:hypothetical protein
VERANIPTVRQVVDELHTMEHKIDDAIRHCASFIVTMVDASREMQLSSTVGSTAYTDAAQTLAQLAASRAAAVDMHNGLSDVHAGLKANPVRAHGDLWKITEPKRGSIGQAQPDEDRVAPLSLAT